MIKNSSGMLYTGEKETGPFLAYSLDVKSSPDHINTGDFLQLMLEAFIERFCSGMSNEELEEFEEMIQPSLESIITSDDDVEIIIYEYGHDLMFGSISSFVWCLGDYLVYRIWNVMNYLGASISPSEIESILFSDNYMHAMEYFEIYANGNTSENVIGYEIPGNSSSFNGDVVGTEYIYLGDLDSIYISDLSKFITKYADPMVEDQNYSSSCSNQSGSFKELLINETTINYQNETEYYIGRFDYYFKDSSNLNIQEVKFVADYIDTLEVNCVSATGKNVEIQSNTTSGFNAETLFKIHEAAHHNYEYLHIKLYLDTKFNFPLPIIPITLTAGDTSADVGQAIPVVSVTEEGNDHMSGNYITSRGISINNSYSAGTYPNKVIYQVTYQQPQNCVYDVTCIPGTLTIYESPNPPTPTPTPDPEPDPDPTPTP